MCDACMCIVYCASMVDVFCYSFGFFVCLRISTAIRMAHVSRTQYNNSKTCFGRKIMSSCKLFPIHLHTTRPCVLWANELRIRSYVRCSQTGTRDLLPFRRFSFHANRIVGERASWSVEWVCHLLLFTTQSTQPASHVRLVFWGHVCVMCLCIGLHDDVVRHVTYDRRS